jgi:hypothetical protein
VEEMVVNVFVLPYDKYELMLVGSGFRMGLVLAY